MIPAAKHLDPLLGIDIHIIQPPPPAPPLPIPHPHIGIIMDPFDYLPLLGSTVTIFGLHRAQAGTAGQPIPPSHIPLGGTFIKPPGNEGEVFMGSNTVTIDGDAATYLGLPVLTCQDVGMKAPPRGDKPAKTKQFVLPTTVVLSIPLPVLIGGPPTISLMALGMRIGMAGAMKGLGKLRKKLKKLKKAKKAKKANGVKCNGLHPVNVVTGEQFDTFDDAAGPPDTLFRWQRHYTTRRRDELRALGSGFRHSYEHDLLLAPQGWRYERWDGEVKSFEPLTNVGDISRAHDFVLERTAANRLELSRGDDPVLVFAEHEDQPNAQLIGLRDGLHELSLRYDDGRLVELTETGALGDDTRYVLAYDEEGRLTELRRDAPHPKRLAQYHYDRRGCLVEATNAEGGQHRYEYDAARLMVKMIDPRHYSFWWRYDEEGRCVEGAGEDGQWAGTIAYFPEERETRVVEAGGEWVFRYDDNGTLRELVDPFGGVTTREVDDDGRVIREIDNGGSELRWLYDRRGVHYGRMDDNGVVHPPEIDMPTLPEPAVLAPPTTSRGWCYGNLTDHILKTASLDTQAFLHRVPASCWRGLVDAIDVGPLRDRRLRAPHARRYDDLGQLVHATDADGHEHAWRYDAAGNEVRYRDPDGCEIETRIARWNLPGAEIDGTGATVHYTFNDQELITKVVDAGGTATEYQRDEKGRLISLSVDGEFLESYALDSGDRIIERKDASDRALLSLRYDAHSRVESITLADGGSFKLDYDDTGKPTEASTQEHEVLIERDGWGRVVGDTVDGEGVRKRHIGGRTDAVWFDRFLWRRDRIDAGKWRFLDPAGGVHHLTVDHDGLIIREHDSGLTVVARFHPTGRCEGTFAYRQKSSGGFFRWGVRYRYSPHGDLLEVADSARGTTRFTPDAAHRLVAEDGPAGAFDYELDPAGNLLRAPGLDRVQVRANKILAANGERFTYDDRHHVAKRTHADGADTHYIYNSIDMLEHVLSANRHWSATYDAIGRRLSCGVGAARKRFFWDGERLGAEIDDGGAVRIYAYADDDARVPLLFVDYDSIDAPPESGRVYVIVCDQNGCPSFVQDTSGNIVWWSHRTAPYGDVLIDGNASIELNLRWPGHYYDAETQLHYNRFRYYDPTLSRYLQIDPIGQAGGINLYAYAPNPLVHVDVLGLSHPGRGPFGRAKDAFVAKVKDLYYKARVKYHVGIETKVFRGKTGMLPKHIEQFSFVARKEKRYILVRNVEPHCTKWLDKGYATKPMNIKGKSAVDPPIAGLVPVDQRYNKLKGDPSETHRIEVLGEKNKKALGEPYREYKDPPGKWIDKDPVDPAIAKAVTVPGPDGKPLKYTDGPRKGEDILVMGSPDPPNNPVTGDYDLLAIGSPKNVDVGPKNDFDEVTGVHTTEEKRVIDRLQDVTEADGSERVVHHGPETNNPNAEKLDANLPVTAFGPDGEMRILHNEQELKAYYKEASANGYDIPVGEGWGW